MVYTVHGHSSSPRRLRQVATEVGSWGHLKVGRQFAARSPEWNPARRSGSRHSWYQASLENTHVLPDLYNDLVNTTVHCLVYLKSLLQLGSETCKRNSTGQSTGKLTCAECNQRCRNCKNRLLHSSKRTCVRAWERSIVCTDHMLLC